MAFTHPALIDLCPSPESRDYLRELRQQPPFGADGREFDLDILRNEMLERQEPDDSNFKCIPAQIGELRGEWVMSAGADPNVRLLYLHGGGYVAGSTANRIPVAARISEAVKCAVLLLDYRLAPEYPFPAALEDCIHGHEWMIQIGPNGRSRAKATFIAGDSAGGGLTLATMLAIRDRGLVMPTGGIPLSPFADLTLTGDSILSEARNDPVMHPRCLPFFADLYLGKADPHNPLASPVYGDYHDIPPLLIQAGEYEIIRDDSVRAAAKAQADGVTVQLEIWPGMVHVFQSRDLPETRLAMAHIAKFVQSLSCPW